MERDYCFENADEALAFCDQLSKSGTADLFRGQTKDWPSITPSLFRGNDIQRAKATAILTQFIEWANAVPQMARYWGNPKQITAIAQHYGIPTPYLDLTTDPQTAAVFAATSATETSDDQAVIYCFKRHDLQELPNCVLHELDVANLWRLKAQRGLFLEILAEADVSSLRRSAIRVHFPARRLREEEQRRIYPPRKSALETVIDQWIYRHTIDGVLSDVVPTGLRLSIRRYSYPGVARWRAIPDLDAGWISWEDGWVFQNDEEIVSPRQDDRREIVLPSERSIHKAFDRLKVQIWRIIRRYRSEKQPFDFQVTITDHPVESALASVILNRCWDGLRVHPYSDESIVCCLASTAVALRWRIDHPDVDWENLLWGEVESIDAAPVGGHLDSASVSKIRLMDAFHEKHYGILTEYSRRKSYADKKFLTNYIVDPWILFDFEKFSRIFVEEFIPSCIGWYWKSCLESEDLKLGELWAISFNPALLGFVTMSSYRFHSPIATEADVAHVILVSSDMNEDDLEEIFISCLPAVLGGGEPFTLKFTDYGADPREIWEIETVVEQCRVIAKIGGISVLDVAPGMRDLDKVEEGSPQSLWERKGLGALHVWAIANNRLGEINGVPLGNLENLLQEFWHDLLESNSEIERRGRSQSDWPSSTDG